MNTWFLWMAVADSADMATEKREMCSWEREPSLKIKRYVICEKFRDSSKPGVAMAGQELGLKAYPARS